MSDPAHQLAANLWASIGGAASAVDALTVSGEGDLPSGFAVTDFACATIGVAGIAVAELIASAGHPMPAVDVDRRRASFWFGTSLKPIGWEVPPVWDPIAGDYHTRDGWIRLHTNAPHHRRAAELVLGAQPDRAAMAKSVASWAKHDLESAIVESGGCAAEMRTIAEWASHDQGRQVNAEPLVHLTSTDRNGKAGWAPEAAKPLAGVRVLDLTRVLAGPVATRFLAGFGADVLRIDPPGWDEAGIAPEVTLGKRCAGLDLRHPSDRDVFESLLARADIVVHGYRPGALEGLGLGTDQRRAIRPGLIDVCLDAYGWSGPWASRRGFDSLVQMSSGIAAEGMRLADADKPMPLPVQALDQGTGYLIAATVVRALSNRIAQGTGTLGRLSLARTAKFLIDAGTTHTPRAMQSLNDNDLAKEIEQTDWGAADRVLPPLVIQGATMRWDRAANRLRSAEAVWTA